MTVDELLYEIHLVNNAEFQATLKLVTAVMRLSAGAACGVKKGKLDLHLSFI